MTMLHSSKSVLSRRLGASHPSGARSSCPVGLLDKDRWQTSTSTSSPPLSSRTIRSFHSTDRREIVPLIGAAVIFGVGRYSWKAMKRMDDEWEDYQWELKQYDMQRARNDPSGDSIRRTISIDLGTVYTKLAKSHPQPEVLISREGDRAFFNGIVYSKDDAAEAAQRGRAALERFHFEKDTDDTDDTSSSSEEQGQVVLPWRILNSTNSDQYDTAKTVSDVLTPALTEALDRLDYQTGQHELRTAVTVPVQHAHSHVYHTAFSKILPNQESHTMVLLPDPVAAVWGAQHKNLLPLDEDPHHPRTVMVIDVGGHVTQLSIIQKDVVLSHLSLPWGGETPIELLVDLLAKESPSPLTLTDARSLSALQSQARTAVAELAGKGRVKVHVPYLFADPSNHHLDTTVSRPVLEQAIQADIRDRLVPSVQEESSGGDEVLSRHMPAPTDLQSLLTSVVTQLLEISQQTPMTVHNVLLVGGGFKSPSTVESARSALYALMGPDATQKTVVPESSLLTELTVLGAASMLPAYEYSVDSGLHRMDTHAAA
jgi:molecular chaperone DnaK (HSP70)